MVEQEGDGVTQDITKQTACQVPQVARPYALYGVALCELRIDGVDPVAKTAQEGASFGVGIALLGLVGGRKLDAPPSQFLPNWGRPVVAIPNHHASGTLDQPGHYRKLVGIGRSYREAGYEPRPTDPEVHPEAVDGLLEEGVFAEGGLSSRKRWQR
jgi:hypothetical protein